jgi:3-hydroxybutyryl-CoA dehydrogenase
MEIRHVGVVGCGIMGGGIVHVCAVHGYDVTVVEADEERLQKGLDGVYRGLAREVERGRLTEEQLQRAWGRISGSTDLNAVADCDLVIEAVVEDLDVKKALFAELGRICRPETILATNTSSLSLSTLAGASRRPDRVIGIHFFNPPTVLRLVEVISSESTSAETIEAAMEFCDSIDRLTVRTVDSPGFIVNRLLVPFIFDAIRMVESGIASAEDIDRACRFGLNHAMGPIATADLIGLDTLLQISESMFEAYGEPRFKAPTSLRRLVSLGHLGRKTGKGFYDYTPKE